MNNEKLLNHIGDIDPTYIENAEKNNGIYIINRRKWLTIVAAAVLTLMLMGAGYSEYISGWLSSNTWWGVKDNVLFTVKEIDGVLMKTYVDQKTNEFVFEFTGADDAVYSVYDTEIVIYAQKAVGSVYTLRIHVDIMHGYNVQEKWDKATETEEIFSSKGFYFIPVNDLSNPE